MLRWRLLLGVALTGLLIGLGWLDYTARTPGVWLFPLALAALVLGTQETLRLVHQDGMRPARSAVFMGNLCILSINWAVVWQPTIFSGGPISPLTAGGALVMAFTAATLLVVVVEIARFAQPSRNVGNLAGGIFTLAYIGVLLSFAVQLRLQWGVGALVSLLLVVKMGDIGAYTVGRLIGRHKMAPRISPGKTLEGAAGAIVFSVAAAWAAMAWIVPALGEAHAAHRVSSWGWLPFGVAVCLAGMIGDLAESLLKRSAGVKDSSTWLPGFGGVLDLLDSILFAAPVAWFFWFAGWVG